MPDNTPYFDANRMHWDELVGIHLGTTGSDGYNVAALKRGTRTLHAVAESSNTRDAGWASQK